MADGSEGHCHKCGKPIFLGDMKVKRPSKKPGMPNTFSVGGKTHVWVHEKCAPTKLKRHGRKR